MNNFEKWKAEIDTYSFIEEDNVILPCGYCPAFYFCEKVNCNCAKTFLQWAESEAD